MQLLHNGLKDKHSDCALIRIRDFDDGDVKLIRKANALVNEVSIKKPNMVPSYSKAAARLHAARCRTLVAYQVQYRRKDARQ